MYGLLIDSRPSPGLSSFLYLRKRVYALVARGCIAAIWITFFIVDSSGQPETVKEKQAAGTKEEKSHSSEDTKKQITEKYLLDDETTAKVNELAPEIVELRKEADRLYACYRTLLFARGQDAWKEAQKELPGIEKSLEKYLLKLETECEKLTKPMQKEQERLQHEEAELLERMEKLDERGKRSEKYEKQADDVTAALTRIENEIESLRKAALPPYEVGSPNSLFLEELLGLNQQQMRVLKAVEREHPEFVEGRIYLEHLVTDINAPEKTDSENDPDKMKRRYEAAARKFSGILTAIREEYSSLLKDLEGQEEKLTLRVEKTAGKRSGQKYQEALSNLEKQIDSARDAVRFLDLFGKGIVAEDMEKKEEVRPPEKKSRDD